MKKDTLQQLKEGAREGFRQKFFIKGESVSLWIIELANKIINGDLFVKIGSTNDTFQNKEKVALQDLFNQLEDFIDSLITKAYEEGKKSKFVICPISAGFVHAENIDARKEEETVVVEISKSTLELLKKEGVKIVEDSR